MAEIWSVYVSYPNVQKSLLQPCPKANTKLAILNLVVIFGRLHVSYFNKLLLENSSDQLQIWVVQAKDLHGEKLCSCTNAIERRGRCEASTFHVFSQTGNGLYFQCTWSNLLQTSNI